MEDSDTLLRIREEEPLAWGESGEILREARELAEHEARRKRERVEELCERLNLDNVEIVEDGSGFSGKRVRAKGFYNRRTGKITIILSNNRSVADVEQTLLHEAVAHHGLRELFGEAFDEFLDTVFNAATREVQERISLLASRNGWNRRTATEEYLAGLAEDMEYNEKSGWFARVKQAFIDMLERFGFRHLRAGTLSDNELRYILWRSYQNLVEGGSRRVYSEEARDVAMQTRLGTGGFEVDEKARLREINERFNEQLDSWESGSLRPDEVVNAGYPTGVMRQFMPQIPILLRQKVLSKSRKKHGLSAREMHNLPEALAKPIFVFKSTEGTVSLLTRLRSDKGENLFVAVELGKDLNLGGRAMEVNDILTIHGRETENVVLPIVQNGTLAWVDKEKGLEWLHSAKSNSQAITTQILDSAAKIVENFENPTISEQNYNNESDDDVLLRDGDFTERDRVMASGYYERMLKRGSWQFREAMQDSMLGLKTLYEAIGGSRKLRIENIPGYQNAYLYENRMSSTNNAEQSEYFTRYMKPLLDEINELVRYFPDGKKANRQQRELRRQELTDYMMAKHGLERNAYMRAEAASNGEETERDFAGLTALTGEADWKAAEAAAQKMVDDYEAENKVDSLWDKVNAATRATLDKIFTSGMISEETYNKVLGMYQYYIPLRGWDETTSDEVYGYLTSNDGPLLGNVFKKAKGRLSKADDPIAYIAKMADDAIRQGNRNIMKQRFLNYVLDNPSDLVSVNRLWLHLDDTTGEWSPIFPELTPDMTPEEVEEEVKKFEEKVKLLAESDPDHYKQGRDAKNVPYKVVNQNMREHQVLVKRDGLTYVLTINGNPRAAQALNGLTNPDTDTSGVVGNMLKLGEYVNRHLSAFYTTRYPDFVVSNFLRDMLYSNCMTWVKESPSYALRFNRNFGRVNPVIIMKLVAKWENGTLNKGDYIERMFLEFMRNGGETGYTSVRDIEGHKRAIAAELKKQGSVGRQAWSALGSTLDLFNRGAENCARFAAFLTSREMGRTLDRSIYDAKEVSVNFNKKGSGGKFVNATGQKTLGKIGSYLSGGGRIAYVFWSAGVQGLTNFARQAKRNPKKFLTGAAALFTLGALIPLLAQLMGVGDGDDDDKNAYYNLPEYIRRSNICFRVGDQWITIPLPIEYRPIYGLGELATGVISGNERYSGIELALHIVGQISQIMPLDMLEGGGGVSPFIPSAFKPFTEAYIMNKGWTGLPVYRDNAFNKMDPEWTKAYSNADQHLVDFARWLNETTGGDDYKKGAIDINPAKIEYLLNGTFGGVVSFPMKILKSGETMFGKRDFEWRNVPLANRVVKTGDERTEYRKLQNEYFKYYEEYKETNRLRKKYENAAADSILGYAERENFLHNSDEYLRFEVFERFKPEIDAIRSIIKEESDPNKSKELQKDLYQTQRDLVNALHDPKKYLESLEEASKAS